MVVNVIIYAVAQLVLMAMVARASYLCGRSAERLAWLKRVLGDSR